MLKWIVEGDSEDEMGVGSTGVVGNDIGGDELMENDRYDNIIPLFSK